MNTLQIGLESWIIQDGNYSDFSVGQEIQFALEFHANSMGLAEPGTPRFDLVGPGLYSIHGRVDFVDHDAWVVDFGLRAYQGHQPPAAVRTSSWIRGEIYLGVDCFDYFERLRKLPGMPELTYKWFVANIRLETTPWLTAGNSGVRDPLKTSFKDIKRTDAWHDDGGCAYYILECERVNPS